MLTRRPWGPSSPVPPQASHQHGVMIFLKEYHFLLFFIFFCRNFDTNMMRVTGRVISAPQWNLVGGKLPIDRWALIDFTYGDSYYLLNKMMVRCRNPMKEPLYYCNPGGGMQEFASSNHHLPENLLKHVVDESSKKNKEKLQLIVCVMTRRDWARRYRALKWISETKIGVFTKCCLSSLGDDDQYNFSNLCIKINAGNNSELNSLLPHSGRATFIVKGGRNTECPSIAAFDDLATGKVIFHPVDQLYTVEEPSSFWICAIITSFIDDWWYLACTKCHRKLVKNDNIYDCSGCKKSYTSGIYRYKVRLEVLDSTAYASFLCWDQEAEKLVGKSCHDLRVEFLENQRELEDLPYDLLKLIYRTALFKITVRDGQIHNESSAFSVNRVVTEPTLVAMYNKWTLEETHVQSPFLLK